MNRHILYIEDDQTQLELVQKLLEHSLPDVIVETCFCAEGAEAFLNSRSYDLIICEVALPGELGTDIAGKILERDAGQAIYLMSEYTGSKIREGAARIGLELQRKPSVIYQVEFVEEVKRLLNKPCDSAIAGLSEPGAVATGLDPNGEAAAVDQHGNDAAPRGNSADVTNGNSAAAAESSRPLKAIRLTSPHVLAARASLS